MKRASSTCQNSPVCDSRGSTTPARGGSKGDKGGREPAARSSCRRGARGRHTSTTQRSESGAPIPSNSFLPSSWHGGMSCYPRGAVGGTSRPRGALRVLGAFVPNQHAAVAGNAAPHRTAPTRQVGRAQEAQQRGEGLHQPDAREQAQVRARQRPHVLAAHAPRPARGVRAGRAPGLKGARRSIAQGSPCSSAQALGPLMPTPAYRAAGLPQHRSGRRTCAAPRVWRSRRRSSQMSAAGP